MSALPETPLLDTVHLPADLRKLRPDQLRQFADELRAEMISAVSAPAGIWARGLAWSS
jgi:1-deoxy-D-xylulose-5-phosphate synthase